MACSLVVVKVISPDSISVLSQFPLQLMFCVADVKAAAFKCTNNICCVAISKVLAMECFWAPQMTVLMLLQ